MDRECAATEDRVAVSKTSQANPGEKRLVDQLRANSSPDERSGILY